MRGGSVARRYAKALLGMGLDRGSADAFADDLAQIASLLRGHAELRSALGNPVFPLSQRRAALAALADRASVAPVVRVFLNLLVDRGRLGELDMIEREYRAMADAAAGRVRAMVTSARPLSDAMAERLRAALATATRKQVLLERQLDPELLGGLQVKVGSTLFDGGVRSRLHELGERMLAT